MSNEIELPKQKCECGYEANRAKCIAGPDAPAKEGDMGMCFNCGRIQILEKDLKVRSLTNEEVGEMFYKDPRHLLELCHIKLELIRFKDEEKN